MRGLTHFFQTPVGWIQISNKQSRNFVSDNCTTFVLRTLFAIAVKMGVSVITSLTARKVTLLCGRVIIGFLLVCSTNGHNLLGNYLVLRTTRGIFAK